MDDQQRLLISLEARLDKYEKNLARANSITATNFRKMEQRAQQSASRMEKAFAGTASGISRVTASIGAAFAAITSAKAAQDLIDSSIKIQNQLKTTGLAGKELANVYQQLLDSAQKNATPLEALVTLYSRTSGAAKDLGASQQDLLRFTDGISLAMRVSGQSASESAGALLQLAQALGDGKVQAEEYNSLLDAGRPILEAVAAGMKEAGGSVSALTRLVKDGKVSSEAFFRAFLQGLPTIQAKVANSEQTISSSFVRLQNVLIDAAKRFNTSAKAAGDFSKVINAIAGEINGINFESLVSQIEAVTTAVQNSIKEVSSWADWLGRVSGAGNLGELLVSSLPGDTVKSYLGGALVIKQSDMINRRVTSSHDVAPTNAGGLTADAIRRSQAGQPAPAPAAPKGGRLPAAPGAPADPKPDAPKPISLADYPVPASGSGGSGGRGKGGGGRSRGDFASDLKQLQDRTQAIQAATAAQAALNPAIDDYGAALATAQAKQQLLNDAQRQNKTITPEMAAQIDAAAGAYGRASAAAAKLQEQQDEVRQTAENALGTARDVTKGLISDLANGVSGAEALRNALARVGDAILDNVLDKVFSLKNAGGIFGGLFGGGGQAALAASGTIFGLFAKGGYTGDGGKYEPAGIVHRGEYVMSKEATRRIGVGNLEAQHRGALSGYADGGYVGNAPAIRKPDLTPANSNALPVQQITISAPVTVNANGGTPEQNADLARRTSKELETTMRSVVADELRRQTKVGNYLRQRGR